MERTVVCKHWLKGLCDKGDDCEWLHVHDLEKMPVCDSFSTCGKCTDRNCPLLHKKRKLDKTHDDGEEDNLDSPILEEDYESDEGDVEVILNNPVHTDNVEDEMTSDDSDEDVEITFDKPEHGKNRESKIAIIVKCNYCKENGHAIPECPVIARKIAISNANAEGQSNRTAKCNYCKQNGHMIPECPAIAKLKCNYCKENGHLKSKCPVLAKKAGDKKKPPTEEKEKNVAPEPQQPAKETETNSNVLPTNGQLGESTIKLDENIIKCAYCKENGHRLLQCPVLGKKEAGRKSKVVKSPGHRGQQVPNCTLDQVTCCKCNQKGHHEDNCPAPNSGTKNKRKHPDS